jgi:RHS repeat-associated protein
VFLRVLPTAKDAGGTIAGWEGAFGSLPNAEGTLTSDFALDPRRIVRAQAIACSEDEVHDDKGLECCSAGGPPTTVGDPVQLFDGSMTYVEHDPLPDDTGRIFTRVYQSTHSQYDGGLAFGAPWFSAFDAGIALSGSSAIVYTENDDHAVFDRQADGSWKQSWPRGHAARGTLSGSEAAGYLYRADDSSIVRGYGGSGSHKLTSLLDLRTQRKVIIAYDSAGKPSRVSDDAGRWSCAVTVANGKVAQIAVDGRPDIVWNYSYNGVGLLSAVTLAGSPAPWRSYEYERHGILPTFDYLSRVRDSIGSTLEQHHYDDAGRALTSLGPSGDITNMQYIGDRSAISKAVVTRADGSVTTYQQTFTGDHDATIDIDGGCASCGGHDSTYAFDRFGHAVRTQDGRGYISESTYDASGEKLLSTTRALTPAGCDPATDALRCRLSSAQLGTVPLQTTSATRVVRFAYDDPNWPDRPTRIEREGAAVETFTFDAATGETLTHAFIGAGETHVTTAQLYDGTAAAAFDPGGAFQSSWLSLPQPRGLLRSVDGPRSDVADVTTYVYYPLSPSVPASWQSRVAAIRNAAGHVTRFEDYDVFGNAQAIVDPNGVTTRRAFDALGRLVASTVKGVAGCDISADPLCATDLVTTNRYANVTGPLSATVEPNANAVVYDYDTRGRVAAISRGPSTTDLRERMAFTYDAATQQTATEQYLANLNGVWTEKRRESYAYDASGRLMAVTHADGTSIRYTYDAGDGLIGVQDERHSQPNTRYDYDPARRIAALRQTLGTLEVRTGYRYDAQDNVTAIVDPNGNETRFTFDEFSRMRRQESPVSGTTTFNYDAAGNLTSSTDSNGATTTRAYDALNRVISSDAVRSGLAAETVSSAYDDPAVRFGIGRLTSMVDPTGSTSYAYERRGLLAAERKVVDGASYLTSFLYDANGNRRRVRYPSGRAIEFAFDYFNRPFSAAGFVNSAGYAPFGPLSQIAFANGATATTQYDARYRPLENKLTAASGVLADYIYSHDAGGNITQIRDALDGGYTRDFAYDDLNRLVTATSGSLLWGSGSFAYDLMGNMLSASVGSRRASTFTYAGTTPKLTSVRENGTDSAVAYDGAGNEVAAGAQRSSYSSRNLLSSVDNLAFAYDGRGVRTITSALVDLLSLTSGASVTGGGRLAAVVTLTGPAPSAGAVIALSSSASAASVPSNVIVSAGNVTATFEIATSAVAVRTIVTIAATFGATTRSVEVAIDPPSIGGVSLNPASVAGGDTSTLTVSLDAAAPAEGVVVRLSSSDARAAVPPFITVAGGTSSATATVSTTAVTTPVTASITATTGTVSKSAVLTINAPLVTLVSIALSPASIEGGFPVTGTVALTAAALTPLTIGLTSDDASVASVPPTLTIAQGAISANFTIATTTILAPASIPITAALGDISRTATLSVLPPSRLALYRLTIEPPNVAGGSTTTATLTLTAAAPGGGADVPLSSSLPSTVVVPSSVKITPGNSSATFIISTASVSAPETALVSGSFGGFTQAAPLTVIPASAISIASLALNPATVTSGAASVATVTMTAPAPAGGVLVTIATKQKNVVSVPSSVIVPGGSSSVTFTVTAQTVHNTKTAEIAATYASITKSAVLTVTASTAAAAPATLGVSAQAAEAAPRRISLYTPELNLLAETESSSAATPPLAYEYVWFAGRPVAQIDVATGTSHFTFTDHLGTPIIQTDSAGRIDWRAEYEPYGAVFALRAGAARHQPLRFPGQEDGETYYNVFRWYRAEWGRYTSADPLGISSDLHVYRYAAANPITRDDPLGLDSAGCDEIGKYLIEETPCRLECCAAHDRCYDLNRCSAGSWKGRTPRTPCDIGGACSKCNDDVKGCFKTCLRRELLGVKDDPRKPNYYCGKKHMYVSIPGDFATLAEARLACECDYALACPYAPPSRPVTVRPKRGR